MSQTSIWGLLMRRCLYQAALPFWGSRTHRGLEGPPLTWCCGGFATSSSQLKERNAARDREPKLSNLPLPLLYLSSSLQVTTLFVWHLYYHNVQRNKRCDVTITPSVSPQWSSMVPPLWRAPCLPAPSRPTPPPATPPPAETTLPWLMSCTLQSPSTALGRSMASLSEPSECTWGTATSTACITWFGWGNQHQIVTMTYATFETYQAKQKPNRNIQIQQNGANKEE